MRNFWNNFLEPALAGVGIGAIAVNLAIWYGRHFK